MTAHHLTVDGVYSRLSCGRSRMHSQTGWCLYPTVRLVEDICHVGWYRIVVFCCRESKYPC